MFADSIRVRRAIQNSAKKDSRYLGTLLGGDCYRYRYYYGTTTTTKMHV